MKPKDDHEDRKKTLRSTWDSLMNMGGMAGEAKKKIKGRHKQIAEQEKKAGL